MTKLFIKLYKEINTSRFQASLEDDVGQIIETSPVAESNTMAELFFNNLKQDTRFFKRHFCHITDTPFSYIHLDLHENVKVLKKIKI